MARVFPDQPIGTVSSEVLRVYRSLKLLPDEWAVWHRLRADAGPGPDFLVLLPDRRAVLLKVSPATSLDVRNANQIGLFGGANRAAPGDAEQDALIRFRDELAAADRETEWGPAMPGLVVFPQASDRDLATLPFRSSGDPNWAGREQLQAEVVSDWLTARAGPPLSEPALDQVRRTLTPEVIIPAQFTVRGPLVRNTAPQLTDYLLDYDQEWVVKTDLDLSAEARSTARDIGLRLVTGVAGSGKSLIVLYRAQLLRRLFPKSSLLVLTHNRPLIRDLEARYSKLGVPGAAVEFQTFLGWCRKHWPQQPVWRDPLGQRRRRQALTGAWHRHLLDSGISERMLGEELDWFKDRLLFNRSDYLTADRTGRGFALTEAQRQKVYDAFEIYHRELETAEQVDWADVPRRLFRATRNGHRLPVYDAILVDEAQFFAPIWFELIKLCLKPRSGHLFLAADPTQGFLKRRQSWLACGLDVRGKSLRLERSYRTTREILSAATLLYRSRLPDDDEPLLLAEGAAGEMPSGFAPRVLQLSSEQDETTRVVHEIREVIQRGTSLGHILVIHVDWRGAERLLTRLRQAFGAAAAVNAKNQAQGDSGDSIRVCTLNAVTGLESPIVFVVGVHRLFAEERSLRLGEEGRAELRRDNTRKLYMALTRAGQRVVLTCVGEVPETLQRLSG